MSKTFSIKAKNLKLEHIGKFLVVNKIGWENVKELKEIKEISFCTNGVVKIYYAQNCYFSYMCEERVSIKMTKD